VPVFRGAMERHGASFVLRCNIGPILQQKLDQL
jgi:hypothetical protein